ncbi:DUF371 domain-containing protein [Candidatus Woesearchaeota archaeon]|nr:DUF371 domain-containing protein [Candidatus Woesearchaeota archaeon]
MQYKFKAYGHPNITAKHKTTLEFTKDKNLSLRGDCIIGVNADFFLIQLKKFIKSLKNNKIEIIIGLKDKVNNKIIKEEIVAEINPEFNSDREMVIRKSDFRDERTFGVRADKGAWELCKEFTEILRNSSQEISIEIKQ